MIEENVIREVEQFLYREARLLDERRFHEWLELLTDDIRYRMTTRGNRYPRISKSIAILDPARYVEEDLEGEDEFAVLDEDKGQSCRPRRAARYRYGVGRGPAVAHPPFYFEYRGFPGRRCR